jgi:hypothetical protein
MDFRQRRKSALGGHGPLFAPHDLTGAERARTDGRVTRGGRQRERDKPRHSGLFEAIRRLDVMGDETERRALADWIRGEYEREYEFADVPLGFVATCYLGPPYVDHRLDLSASIVDHFSAAQTMPAPFEEARMNVRSGAYEFVEVYLSGKIISVRADGTPVHSESEESS